MGLYATSSCTGNTAVKHTEIGAFILLYFIGELNKNKQIKHFYFNSKKEKKGGEEKVLWAADFNKFSRLVFIVKIFFKRLDGSNNYSTAILLNDNDLDSGNIKFKDLSVYTCLVCSLSEVG